MKAFANPPQYVSTGNHCRVGLDVWSRLDRESNLPEGVRDPIEAAAEQNIGISLWWLGEYEDAQKQFDKAQKTRSSVKRNEKKTPTLSEQSVKLRGLLATGLTDYTLGQYIKLRNTIEECRGLTGGMTRSDPHRLALKMLELRGDLAALRYARAELRGIELLKEAAQLGNAHPALIAARFRTVEAYLGNAKNLRAPEAKKLLDEAFAALNELGAAEHIDMVTYWRLLAYHEYLTGRPDNAKTALDRGDALAKKILYVNQTGKARPHVETALNHGLRGLTAIAPCAAAIRPN
ncbi:MAG: hypothetical protein QM811_06260 [Pirellulales bacterium]